VRGHSPLGLILALVFLGGATPATGLQVPTTDSAVVAGTVLAFHQALTRGDSLAALELLSPDAVVLEAGGVENRDQYRQHHLPSDIRFGQAVTVRRGPVRVVVEGSVAWTTSTWEASGSFQDRPINSTGAELVVLTRSSAGWRIRAIHWSSRSRRSGS
jgi:ketosteroid isomerase-like protein